MWHELRDFGSQFQLGVAQAFVLGAESDFFQLRLETQFGNNLIHGAKPYSEQQKSAGESKFSLHVLIQKTLNDITWSFCKWGCIALNNG